jgi:predicted dehydrogenase
MIRIGAVNLDISHPKAFSQVLAQENRARYVAVYNDGFRGDDEVEAFIKTFGLEKRCESLEELADCVDVGFVQGCNWDKHLEQAQVFIKAGKPVYIDKPIVGNLADCHKLEALAAEGAVILGSSSVRYCEEIADFLARPEEERGRIMHVHGTAGVDEFNYASHVVEAIFGLVGAAADSTQFVGRSTCEDKVCETFFIRFENGVTATYNTFHGTWQPFEMVIMTTKGTYQFRIDCGKIYKSLLDRICDFMETGESQLASIPEITNSIKAMLAGRISRENGGQTVKLAEIPADDPGFDGAEFEKGYAAAAGKIYLN